MIGYLIGERLDEVCDIWHGTEQELRARFDVEGHGYRFEIYDSDGSLVCELRIR